jgi:hypothetical protein
MKALPKGRFSSKKSKPFGFDKSKKIHAPLGQAIIFPEYQREIPSAKHRAGGI